jgi:uncharacterized protein (DUF1501 family)
MRRREFIKLAAAASALPVIWIPRRSKASTPAESAVKHLLVLFAQGGFRSHATFNAVGTHQHNPFGTQPAANGTQWTLGAACGAQDIPSSLGTVPAFAKVTNDVAVIPCVDHLPMTDSPEIDHVMGARRIASGAPDGTSGLLSIVGKHLPLYKNGFNLSAVPPVEVSPSEFGLGSGDYASTRPISLFGAAQSFSSDLPIGKGWKIPVRAQLDQAFRDHRPRGYRARLSNFLLAKRNTAIFADMLKDPQLNILSQPNATGAGFSNAQLIEILGNSTLDSIGDMQMTPSWGPDVAMALRFLQFGAPFAVVTRATYDMHDNERTNYAPRTMDLVRQLAGLNFILKRMTHPSGGMFWDHTLVVVLSEFSRNNTMPDTGFNSGNGSDHVTDASASLGPQRNQAVAWMGGPLTAKGKMLGSTDSNLNPLGKVYTSRSLLSTMLDVLGVDYRMFWQDDPIAELFT